MISTIPELLLVLSLGLLLGGLITWLLAKFLWAGQSISKAEVQNQYVLREVHLALQQQADLYRDDLFDKEEEIKSLTAKLSGSEQTSLHLEEKLKNQQETAKALQERSKLEFENLANRILEEKTQKFTTQNQQQLKDLLTPLRENIKTFEDQIEKRFWEDTKDRISLKKEIEQLKALNLQLSEDANNLVNALKGDSKIQGDWGELRLELLLEKAGLVKDIHYMIQTSFKDEDGRQKRPDFIINLPEDKHLIVDSKVSLVAYEKFFQASNSKKKEKYIKAHLDSIRQHIKDLSSKNYQQLYQINSPDYLMLFIPIEPAFSLALQEDNKLFMDALDKNVVLVSTSTLLATMRTVSYIWKQEKQKNNVLEIARQSGVLYDKFCNFVADLRAIGNRLDQANKAYSDAMNKLTEARRPGDTLIGRAEKIRELGAKASKNLPKDLLDG